MVAKLSIAKGGVTSEHINEAMSLESAFDDNVDPVEDYINQNKRNRKKRYKF
jgi:hypothetical protein